MKEYIITIKDAYEDSITDNYELHIDNKGIVWYLFDFDSKIGNPGTLIPVGTIQEVKE